MFVKKFLYYQQQDKGYVGINSPFKASRNKFKDQIESISAYIRAYHYSNFDEVYEKFDRNDNILLDDVYKQKNVKIDYEQYELYSYLGSM